MMDFDLTSIAAIATGTLLALAIPLVASSPEPAPQHAASADTTETKPLRLLMAGLAQDMDRINAGIWYEDYDLMQQGGEAIAHHPRIPPEQIAKIKEALENEFETFVGYDEAVHQSAVELAEAAAERDLSGVLDRYRSIQSGCVGCHSSYRDRLRPVLTP